MYSCIAQYTVRSTGLAVESDSSSLSLSLFILQVQCTLINITVNVPTLARRLIFNCLSLWPEVKLTTQVKYEQERRKHEQLKLGQIWQCHAK